MPIKLSLIDTIKATAEVFGKQLSNAGATMFLATLDGYSEDLVLAALGKCARELKYFPTPADIISRIDSGHPGLEEAWAMIPKDEYASVVWTQEMADAFGAIRTMIDVDVIGARMAFREIYTRLISDAKDRRSPPKWFPSLGRDKSLRDAPILDAIRKGRLGSEAMVLIGHATTPSVRLIESAEDAQDLTPLGEIVARLGGPPRPAPISNQTMTDDDLDERKRLLRAQARRIAEDENG